LVEGSQSVLEILISNIKNQSFTIYLVLLIMLSGLFSASETALTAFKRMKLKQVEDENPKAAKVLKKWLKNPNEILTTLLLGNNVVNILASTIAATVAIQLLGKENQGEAIATVTIVMAFLILIFGEITPKIIAKRYSEKIAEIIILPVYYLSVILYPIVTVLIWISKLLGKFFGISISEDSLMVTEEEIKDFVSVGEEEGVIEVEEREMIHSIFDFGETTVKEIIVPRTKMFAVEANKSLGEIWDDIIKNGFSRIPVYEDSIDNIIGIMYLKDLLNVAKEDKYSEPAKNYVREPYFIPESKAIVDLLKEFREKKVHIAIVLDEYGGTFGMLTIEDILEEIVGDINDEYDEEVEEEFQEIEENKFKVKAIVDIETINKSLNIDLPISEEYDTLAGYISYVLGRVPEKHDKIELDGVRLEVINLYKHRIENVIIEKIWESE